MWLSKHKFTYLCSRGFDYQCLQDYKEFTDAEGLLSLPTSDFHKSVFLEMRNITNGTAIDGVHEPVASAYGLSTITLPLETPLRHTSFTCNNNGNNVTCQSTIGPSNLLSTSNNNYTNGDLASVDSSDTYASCQTHPFVSQADLDQDEEGLGACDLDLNNLYINPLEKNSSGNLVSRPAVKKSASGDTALRNLCDDDMSPMREVGFGNYGSSFEPQHCGSRISLNETVALPKHRKTRFQQGVPTQTIPLASVNTMVSANKQKARFQVAQHSQENLSDTSTKKKSRSSFMPAKSIASATKLINQHLFGIQNVSSKGRFLSTFYYYSLNYICIHLLFIRAGKVDKKLSVSIDSIDKSPTLESHRRSKSILKNKSDGSKMQGGDPESERLLSDNLSGAGLSDISVSVFSIVLYLKIT